MVGRRCDGGVERLRSNDLREKRRIWRVPRRQKLGSEPNFVLASLCSGQAIFLNWDLIPISVYATFYIALHSGNTAANGLNQIGRAHV